MLDKPSVPLGLGWYFTAYTELHTCRVIGMSEGRIPWSAVNDYAIRNHLSDLEFHDLWKIVSAVDAWYLQYKAEKSSSVNRKPPTTGANDGASRVRGHR